MTQWNIDTTHSTVGFSVRHMVFAKVNGRFTSFSGLLDIDDADLTKSKIAVSVDAASIDTHEEKRDGHLRSADFFDVEKHPKLTFEATRIEKVAGDEYTLTGELGLHGVTKVVTFAVEYGGRGKDPWGGERMGFHAKTQLNRLDFGLKWNQVLETGGVLVGEKIDVSIDLELTKAK